MWLRTRLWHENRRVLVQPGERLRKCIAADDVRPCCADFFCLEFERFFRMENHVIVIFVNVDRLVFIHRHGEVLQVRIKVLAQNLRQEQVHRFRNPVAAGIDNAGTEKVQHSAL